MPWRGSLEGWELDDAQLPVTFDLQQRQALTFNMGGGADVDANDRGPAHPDPDNEDTEGEINIAESLDESLEDEAEETAED